MENDDRKSYIQSTVGSSVEYLSDNTWVNDGAENGDAFAFGLIRDKISLLHKTEAVVFTLETDSSLKIAAWDKNLVEGNKIVE